MNLPLIRRAARRVGVRMDVSHPWLSGAASGLVVAVLVITSVWGLSACSPAPRDIHSRAAAQHAMNGGLS